MDELQCKLESLVFMVLTVRRSVRGPAEALGRYPQPDEERFLDSVQFITGTSVELAFNFCHFAPPALGAVPVEHWHRWVLHLMDRSDQGGVRAAIVSMQDAEGYVEELGRAERAVRLEDLAGVLERFALGLSGRPLKLEAASQTYTDTETLHLPAVIDCFSDREDNFRLYKTTAVHLWAQTWFGTWRAKLSDVAAGFEDPETAVRVFHALERLRLDGCVERHLPGSYRDMRRLAAAQGHGGLHGVWAEAADRLRPEAASLNDSYTLLPDLYRCDVLPEPLCYQGDLFPERTEAVLAARLERDRTALGEALSVLLARVREDLQPPVGEGDRDPPVQASRVAAPERPEGFRVELRVDACPVTLPPDVQHVLDSIAQDLGEAPPEFLVPAGHGRYHAGRNDSEVAERAAGSDAGSFVYPEWDHGRGRYRQDWCLLREREVHPQREGFVAQTLVKHHRLVGQLRRNFEALRGADRLLKRQPYGDEIDIDACVESYADQRVGLEASAGLFVKRRRVDRDIAVMFLVDMSGSTKGWINDMEREALVLLCEALESLGDRYAIYGFSGFTHKRCELFRIKHVDEPYGSEVKARISGIRPQDYTRMGVAIRHLTRLLGEVQARTQLLITLSDGRPDDQDGYRGSYGIEDTRQALIEARYRGIHPYCITIDDQAMEYLPDIYGPAGFTVVSDVRKLPQRVADIYRRITQ